MTTSKKYIIQHTGYPVAGRAIQENEWKKLSSHPSATAAIRKIRKETAHLSPGSWDDHYRVIDPDGRVMMFDKLYFEAEIEKANRPF